MEAINPDRCSRSETTPTPTALPRTTPPSTRRTGGASRRRPCPVPGNHEYQTANAAGYFGYFSGIQPYYSFDLGAWHLIALNSEIPVADGLRAGELARGRPRCERGEVHPRLLAPAALDIRHRALNSNAAYSQLWVDLYAAGADVVLNGHVHNYERFAQQNAAGQAAANGIREFVVGTGGKLPFYASVAPIAANSEVRNSSSHGVLKLTLHSRVTTGSSRPWGRRSWTSDRRSVRKDGMAAIDDIGDGLGKIRTANRVDGSRASYAKDNPSEYAKVMAYLDGGARPDGVTSDMGVGLVLVEDGRRKLIVAPPPPPPPASTATATASGRHADRRLLRPERRLRPAVGIARRSRGCRRRWNLGGVDRSRRRVQDDRRRRPGVDLEHGHQERARSEDGRRAARLDGGLALLVHAPLGGQRRTGPRRVTRRRAVRVPHAVRLRPPSLDRRTPERRGATAALPPVHGTVDAGVELHESL